MTTRDGNYTVEVDGDDGEREIVTLSVRDTSPSKGLRVRLAFDAEAAVSLANEIQEKATSLSIRQAQNA